MQTMTRSSQRSGPEVVAHRLQRAIHKGEFAPGELVPSERALAERWKISRPIVREGIGMLVARGVLQRQHGRGTFVNEIDQQLATDVWSHLVRDDPELQRDLLEFRHTLERHAAELAAERHDRADREKLQAAEAAVHHAFCGDDAREQMQADLAFHQAIADATHNQVYSSLMQSMHRILYEHMRLTLAGNEMSIVRENVRTQHRALLQAIVARDVESAGAICAEHIEFVRVKLNHLAPRRRSVRTS
jgi:DNA-binding FadR family transcriptional regulator